VITRRSSVDLGFRRELIDTSWSFRSVPLAGCATTTRIATHSPGRVRSHLLRMAAPATNWKLPSLTSTFARRNDPQRDLRVHCFGNGYVYVSSLRSVIQDRDLNSDLDVMPVCSTRPNLRFETSAIHTTGCLKLNRRLQASSLRHRGFFRRTLGRPGGHNRQTNGRAGFAHESRQSSPRRIPTASAIRAGT